MSTLGSARIAGFDGLRAVAVFGVFLAHRSLIGEVFGSGSAGVRIFFVLSGFLITGILLRQREKIEAGQSSAWPEIKTFFLNRTFRIFPAYYAFIAITAAVWMLLEKSGSPGWWLVYLAYMTNYAAAATGHFAPLGHLWTLAVEEQFYILAAPLFLLAPRRWSLGIAAGIVALGVATFFAMLLMGRSSLAIYVDALVNFATLGVGCAMACLIRPSQGRSSLLVLLGAGALVATGALQHAPPVTFPGVEQFYGVGAALIVAGVVLNQQSLVTRALEAAPLQALGRVSYGFYLWHYVVDVQGPLGEALGPVGTGVANFALTVLVSALSWKLLEAPMLQLRDTLRAIPSRA